MQLQDELSQLFEKDNIKVRVIQRIIPNTLSYEGNNRYFFVLENESKKKIFSTISKKEAQQSLPLALIVNQVSPRSFLLENFAKDEYGVNWNRLNTYGTVNALILYNSLKDAFLNN